jgi:pimeloyl-ACP methyl ester carboxylesterase
MVADMASGNPSAGEFVLLLPGLGRSPRCMARMSARLRCEGFAVVPWGYPSIRGYIGDHADRLRKDVAELAIRADVTAIHFVTHSMGGIIVRAALGGLTAGEPPLTGPAPTKIGRVVMLAPPHQGSTVAGRLAPVLGWWIRPLRDLADAPDSLVRRLPSLPGVVTGVIAAARDGKVRVADTHLSGESDHIVVPGYHTFIMNRADTIDQTAAFLRHGRFCR